MNIQAGNLAPIRVSTNHRYFVDANNDPFFWMSDTAWPLFSQYTLQEAEQYIAARGQQGFNVVKGVLAWPGGTTFEQERAFPNYNGDFPWLDNNPATPNEAYFKHVEYLVTFAARHGVLLNMLPNWGYHVSDISLINVEKARAYGLWLGRRFKDFPNILWTLGGDRSPRGFEDIYRVMASGLREGDGGTHLMSYHPAGSSSSARFFHREDWLDYNLIQTWDRYDRIYPVVVTDVLRTPAKPVVMDEGAYEDGPEYFLGPITPLLVRRQAWWTFMAGGFHTYGHNNSWRVEPGWISALESPGAAQMTRFKAITTSRRWWEMVPCQSLFADGVSYGKTLNVAMRSEDCSCAMLYLSTQCNVQVSLYEINARHIRVTYVNPATGEQKEAGVYESSNQWFVTPNFWEDAVIILDAVE